METNTEFKARQPRRKFLGVLMAGLAGAAALLLAPKRARGAAKKPTEPVTGPILYQRTEETERYYKTLYS